MNRNPAAGNIVRVLKQWAIGLLAAFALFNLLGFVGAPLLIRHVAGNQVSNALSRPVSLGSIRVNPYTLKFELEQIHIGERDGSAGFIDLGKLVVDVSWASLFQLAPVIDGVQVEEPHVQIVRAKTGRFNFSDLIERSPQPEASGDKPVLFAVSNIRIDEGRIDIDDQTLGERHTIEHLKLDVPFLANLASDVNIFVQPLLQATIDGSALRLEGKTQPFSASHESNIELKLERFDLPLYLRYLPAPLPVQVQGRLSSNLVIHFAVIDRQPTVRVSGSAHLADLAVADQQGQPLFAAASIQLDDLSVDPIRRLLQLKRLSVEHPLLSLARSKGGALNVMALASAPSAQSPPSSARKKPQEVSAWKYSVGAVSLADATVALVDLATPTPARLRVSAMQVAIQDISEDSSKPWKLNVSGALNADGKFGLVGTVAMAPLNVALQVDGQALDVTAFAPYFADRINATVASALLSTSGSATFVSDGRAWKAGYTGDASLDDVKLLDKKTSDPFASWSALNTLQVKAAYQDGAADIQIGQIALNRFYARIFLDRNGQLNLNNFVSQAAAPSKSLTRVEEAAAVAAAAPVAASPAPGAGSAMKLQFGQIALHGGHVNFTDNFIKPNYTADLNAIEGKVGSFGTQSTRAAPVELQAKLNADDLVAISGTVNPLVQPPFLDLTAKARGVVLTSFTPYSTKYGGYPIVSGTLDVDLHYQLDNGQLTANNHLMVDQLTFGDHVDSPTATRLPIRLAIALLKNSKGQIDVNVPVSGSLSDPQFSVGELIWHAFVNLFERAISSPFTLLASAFGGSEDLSHVEFDPGSARLTEAALAKLDTLTRALADRTGVTVELTGRADPAVDTPALKERFVDEQIARQKREQPGGKPGSADETITAVSPDEYEKYLGRAYAAAKFEKSRNALGLTKSLPADEMRKLLLANAPVGDDDLRNLAEQRAVTVQQWLTTKVGGGRIEIAAPAPETGEPENKNAGTRVDFHLK